MKVWWGAREQEHILDRETKIIDWKKMRMIGALGGEKLHPCHLLLVKISRSPVIGRSGECWPVIGPSREGSGCTPPRGRWGKLDTRHSALQLNERNTEQSSATPHRCDTELLRVRKIPVLCFSSQKRTTKIGQKNSGWRGESCSS